MPYSYIGLAGELNVMLTNDFTGSGHYWKPNEIASGYDFRRLCDYFSTTTNIKQEDAVTFMVTVSGYANQNEPPIAAPLGATRVGSTNIYKLTAPQGYVVLGDITFNETNIGIQEYAQTKYWCLRADLAATGTFMSKSDDNENFYYDGSIDCTFYFSQLLQKYSDAERTGQFLVGGATCIPGTTVPDDKRFYVLNLKYPLQQSSNTSIPKLTSPQMPQEQIDGTTPFDHRITLPFMAIKDDAFSTTYKIRSTPFYTIERFTNWALVAFEVNQGTGSTFTKELTVHTGVEEANNEEFKSLTDIETSVLGGIRAIRPRSIVAIGKQLGFTQRTSQVELREKTDKWNIVVENNQAVAMWVCNYTVVVKRGDGSIVSSLTMNVRPFVNSSFSLE